MVSVQYGPFNTYIQIRSTTIGKSRVARDPITMYTSWRSNSDIACVTSSSLVLKQLWDLQVIQLDRVERQLVDPRFESQLVRTAAHTHRTDTPKQLHLQITPSAQVTIQPASELVTQNDVALPPDPDNPEPIYTKSRTKPVHVALRAHSHGAFLSNSGLNYSNMPASKADFNEQL
ncbi:protein STICHEL [Dorcoceras hygrometricum]|uniref:Protein STICHEL n=1 Tax=Dorcoceras hygrometricum TaxID=472368 RepID=A0A2Z7B4H2_9LAMI|nr:protein STICHEL [Dorcoceras hygrometricum]